MTRPMLPALACAALLAGGAPARAGESFLIVTPGGPGNQSQAQSFLADFAAALAAGWPQGREAPSFTGYYHVTAGDALASMKAHPPVFVLASPGFYLARRGSFDVLAAPRRSGDGEPVVRLVTSREGPRRALEAGSVAGLAIGGLAAAEPDWTRRVLLAGLEGADAARLVPLARSLEAVRKVTSGEVDVALLHDAEWKRLVTAGKAAGLGVSRTSPRVPEGPVVFPRDAGGDAGARRALADQAVAALVTFDRTPQGQAVLARMGLEGFSPATGADYDAVSRLHAGVPAPQAPASRASP